MFFTWRLWRELRHPPGDHPLFWHYRWRVSAQPAPKRMAYWRWLLLLALLLICASLFLMSPTAFILIVLIGVVLLPVAILLFNSMIIGSVWTHQISAALAREYQSGRYDLLSITPRGALGISWILGAGILHRESWMRTLARVVRLVSTVLLVTFLLVTVLVTVTLYSTTDDLQRRELQLTVLQSVLPLLALAGILWLDRIQATVTALLVGITLPMLLREVTAVRIVAVLAYCVAQVGGYMLIVLLALLLNIILQVLIGGVLADVFLTFCVVLLYYVLREALIGVLLMLLRWQHRITPQTLWASITLENR